MPKRKSVKRVSKTKRNSLRKTLKRKQLRKNSKRVNRRRKSSRKMRGGTNLTAKEGEIEANTPVGRVLKQLNEALVMVVYPGDDGSYEVLRTDNPYIKNSAIEDTIERRSQVRRGSVSSESSTATAATTSELPPQANRGGSRTAIFQGE